jgi:hypothetical protein
MEGFDIEKLRIACVAYFSKEMLADVKIRTSEHTTFVCDSLAIQLNATVFAQRLDEQTVEYPADWWQAFKERFFPGWAIRRWPVHRIVKIMRLYGAYDPHCFPVLPEEKYGRPIPFVKIENPEDLDT